MLNKFSGGLFYPIGCNLVGGLYQEPASSFGSLLLQYFASPPNSEIITGFFDKSFAIGYLLVFSTGWFFLQLLPNLFREIFKRWIPGSHQQQHAITGKMGTNHFQEMIPVFCKESRFAHCLQVVDQVAGRNIF